jgi:hypothetical protein
MKLKIEDLNRLEKLGIGGGVTYEEQMALIKLARENLNGSFDETLVYMSYAITVSICFILLTFSWGVVYTLTLLFQTGLIFATIRIAIRILKGFKN